MTKGQGDAMMPLALLSPGDRAEIVDIRATLQRPSCCGQCGGERHRGEERAGEMGLRAGKMVEMLSNGGPVLLKVDESRIAVDRGLAMKILVRR